tara:strand:+ start:4497 stop:4637 length:141 start_codon:yes stop_codon:yes gene_type:complete
MIFIGLDLIDFNEDRLSMLKIKDYLKNKCSKKGKVHVQLKSVSLYF